MTLSIEHAWQLVEKDVLQWSLRIVAAIAIFVVGRWITRRLVRALALVMEKREVEPTVARFLQNVANAVLLVVNVLAALNALGIPTASMLAVMGAAGLAIGLALKDSLSNIASGVLMVAFRPFRVGDKVECAGTVGRVETISIFYTELRTSDNKTVTIPNSLVTGGVITNFTADDNTRRLELNIGVGYGSDLKRTRQILLDMLRSHPRVIHGDDDKQPQVGITSYGENAVNFILRPWVRGDELLDATYEINESIKEALDANGIEIPFPQRVLHIRREAGLP